MRKLGPHKTGPPWTFLKPGPWWQPLKFSHITHPFKTAFYTNINIISIGIHFQNSKTDQYNILEFCVKRITWVEKRERGEQILIMQEKKRFGVGEKGCPLGMTVGVLGSWRRGSSKLPHISLNQRVTGQILWALWRYAGHSRWVIWDKALESWQALHVLVVQPLHLEVQVHVVGTFAQLVFVMLCRRKQKIPSHFCSCLISLIRLQHS